MNAIAAMSIFNFGSPFESLPLRNYTASNPIKVANLASINSIALTPPLTFNATSDNIAVATAATSGKTFSSPDCNLAQPTSPPKRLISMVRS